MIVARPEARKSNPFLRNRPRMVECRVVGARNGGPQVSSRRAREKLFGDDQAVRRALPIRSDVCRERDIRLVKLLTLQCLGHR
jgi:hypothetical protein